MVGLKPQEIYSLELWELNAVMQAYAEKQKADVNIAILTGYYTAYYMNGGRNVKSPDELMKKTFGKKQTIADGMAQINKIKQLEQKEEKK